MMKTHHPPRAARLVGVLLVAIAGSGVAAERASEHEVEVEVGVGHDGNAFLTPEDPYYDQRNDVTVDPEPTSGSYLPLRLRGDSWIVRPMSRLGISYTARGKVYPDSDLSNAEEAFLRLEPGAVWVLGRRGFRENTLRVSPRFTYNKEVFFDRDTGFDTDLAGTNLADRYTYTATGLEIEYRVRTLERFEWDFEVLLQARDYEEIPGISTLDHDRIEADAEVEIEATDRVALELEAGYKIRSYDDRRARDLDGVLLSSNDALEYRYVDVGATLRIRPSDRWWLYFDLDRRDRTDEFVGYNDYTQDAARARIVFDNDAVRVRLAVRAWQREYDRAFVFDLPQNPSDLTTNPRKDYDTLDVDLSIEVPLGSRGFKVFGDVDWRDQDTADPRYTYAREEIAVGLAWER